MNFTGIELIKYRSRYFMIDKQVYKPVFLNKLTYEILCKLKAGNTYKEIQSEYGASILSKILCELDRLKSNNILVGGSSLFSMDAMYAVDNYKSQPLTILEGVLMVSQRCNLSCRYCYGGKSGTFDNEGLMDYTIADKALDFILNNSGSLPFQKIIFFGGEPLLNFKIIKHVINRWNDIRHSYPGKNLYFGLTTNGTLLSEEIVSFLKQNNVGVTVSLDGPSVIHNYNRPFNNGDPSFNHVIKGIALLQKYQLPISIRTTLTRQSNIDEVYTFLEEKNFDLHNIAIVDYPMVCPQRDYQIDINYYKKTVMKQTEVVKKGILDVRHKSTNTSSSKQLSLSFQKSKSSKRNFPFLCGAGNWVFTFDKDGKIYPCNRTVGDKRFCIGSLNTGVNKKQMSNIYIDFLKSSTKCDNCWVSGLCRGRCFHQKSFSSPTCIDLPETLCQTYRDSYAESILLCQDLRNDMQYKYPEMKYTLERFDAMHIMNNLYGIGDTSK